MKISYLFRSKDLNQFSIENVFNYVIKEVSKTTKVDAYFLPEFKLNFKNIIKNLTYAKTFNGDVFHITGDIHYICLVLPKSKTILTIHDLIGANKGTYSFIKKVIYLLFWVYIPSIKCRYVTVISEKTKEDFLSLCPWATKKTLVIPDPIDDRYQYYEKKFNTQNPRILLIGTSNNKNHERIIKALIGIPCIIDIVGKLPQEEKELLEVSQIDYVNSFNLTDDEIMEKYHNCDIVLFASTYEGFGMPIIEGQRIGRCVVTSNIEPMTSVSGGAACLVNPYDIADIRRGVMKIINNEKFRNQLINDGLSNSKKYTPEIISNMYYKLYKKI